MLRFTPDSAPLQARLVPRPVRLRPRPPVTPRPDDRAARPEPRPSDGDGTPIPTRTDGVIGAPDRGVAAPPGWWKVVRAHRPPARRSSREALCWLGRVPGGDRGLRGRRGGSDREGGARRERAGGASRPLSRPGARAG